MKILSHRGYWRRPDEKNTEMAFRRSFSLCYGFETDVRDAVGNLVISHDMPTGAEISFDTLLSWAVKEGELRGKPFTLALNVKADGLALELRRLLDRHQGVDAFVFDMSVPDTRSYFEAGIPVFSRMSEVEHEPVWLDLAAGVWLDAFFSNWYDITLIEKLLARGKRVCIVSSELHKRPYNDLWSCIKPLAAEDGLMLCTDFPEEASEFFE